MSATRISGSAFSFVWPKVTGSPVRREVGLDVPEARAALEAEEPEATHVVEQHAAVRRHPLRALLEAAPHGAGHHPVERAMHDASVAGADVRAVAGVHRRGLEVEVDAVEVAAGVPERAVPRVVGRAVVGDRLGLRAVGAADAGVRAARWRDVARSVGGSSARRSGRWSAAGRRSSDHVPVLRPDRRARCQRFASSDVRRAQLVRRASRPVPARRRTRRRVASPVTSSICAGVHLAVVARRPSPTHRAIAVPAGSVASAMKLLAACRWDRADGGGACRSSRRHARQPVPVRRNLAVERVVLGDREVDARAVIADLYMPVISSIERRHSSTVTQRRAPLEDRRTKSLTISTCRWLVSSAHAAVA